MGVYVVGQAVNALSAASWTWARTSSVAARNGGVLGGQLAVLRRRT